MNNYTYSNTNNNINLRIFVRKSLFVQILVQVLLCQFLENGDRYRSQHFKVN